MSKIAEQKALEEYPILFSERNGYDSTFKDRRESYIKGYDQAMQDFLERACDYLQRNLWRMINEDGKFRQRFVTDFKNYMKNESEE